jgi:hypothetical protein
METKSKMAAIAAILNEWWHWSSKGTFLQSPPINQKKSDQSTEAFVRKSMETNFKMVAILKIETRRFSKGTFPYSPPTCTIEIDLIRQGVLLEIEGNQFQDGGHIENRNTPIFERNLPLLTPNMHTQN